MPSKVSTQSVHLKLQLQLHHEVGIVVGTIIGGATFVAPKDIISGTGSGGLCLVV